MKITIEQLRTRIDNARKKDSMRAVAIWPDEAEHLVRQVEAVPRWIPVSEKLPDADIECDAATSDGEVFAAFHDGEQWRDLTAMPLADGRVTHWAEKREPPTEDESC